MSTFLAMRNHTDVVPQNVRAEMARRGVRQADLGTALGMSQQALSRRLTGDVSFTVHDLRRVADFLEVRVADLLGESEAVSA